jgi:hypothetical protein
MYIDINFDFRSDSNGKDPDKYSGTLRSYHKTLWSKTLPNGEFFTLDDTKPDTYLYFKGKSNEFFLSSDAITHSYKHWKRMKHIIDILPKNIIEEIFNWGCTIGSYTIFPSNKIDNKPSINQERGTNNFICDRFDITLECIRLYYLNQDNPLRETLTRYATFFDLFLDFKRYVDFFLLQDLIGDDYTQVKFHLPFTGFSYLPIPKSKEEYLHYRNSTLCFIQNRNNRIVSST